MIKSRFLYMLCTTCLLTIGLLSCSKDKNPEPAKTKTDLLTSKIWKISSIGIDTDGDNKPEGPYDLPDCEKDNTFEFKADGKGTTYEGQKCEPSDPASQEFTWSFQNNETVLRIQVPGSPLAGDATIIELNQNSLEAYFDYSMGVTIRVVFKLTH